MSTIKLKLSPRKSFLFLGRIIMNYDMSSIEIDSSVLSDDELRAIINAIICSNVECNLSIGELTELFRDTDRKLEFVLGLKAQRVDMEMINSRYKPIAIEVPKEAPTLEALKEDYKKTYAHLLDLLNEDEGTVLGYLRTMQLDKESEHFAPVPADVLEFLVDHEKADRSRKMIVKGIFNLIGESASVYPDGVDLKHEVAKEESSLEKAERPARKQKAQVKE